MARRSRCSPAISPDCRCRPAPRSCLRAFFILMRLSQRGRSASSPAITAVRAAPRPTCASSACAIATIPVSYTHLDVYKRQVDILRETWSTYLDPSLNPPEIRPWGSKAMINACMDYRFINSFSKRTKLSKATYDSVVARWNELGLSGTPPAISVFEDEVSPGTVT